MCHYFNSLPVPQMMVQMLNILQGLLTACTLQLQFHYSSDSVLLLYYIYTPHRSLDVDVDVYV